MILGAAKFQVDVKEGGGGEGGSHLNVQLTLSGGKVNISTAPKFTLQNLANKSGDV